ncbi:hypothetical protein BESB_037910 [Besnoitia besnoiti]|uniref:Inner membrane complex protein 20 n=1 Tax=Besnoitia besnoiti TaxID=94643 RepID=A0A2A9MN97_BESBE|nr:hypothetical protein BESB_037910 [Besnoitia besnoiti]PFH37333.1 hypothetical protein BESB_037910 [Besnoitia besnoiti]
MSQSPELPVYNSFKVTTPSMSVTLSADDTPLPAGLGAVAGPASLVTVNPGSSSAPVETTTDVPGSVCDFHTEKQENDLKTAAAAPAFMPAGMYKRSYSKAAAALYGDRPVIQPMEAEIEETRAVREDGAEEHMEPHDYTYWDKLRRQHTKTEIRRWTSFFPEQQEDTAFFGRDIDVAVPTAAYTQGTYYERMEEEFQAKSFRLPTVAYVAPPVWIRRTQGVCNGLFRSCQCAPCGDSCSA